MTATEPPAAIQIPVNAIDAGDFGQWFAGSAATQQDGADSDVPCGDCNGCCKSFYFIHVTPDDTDALSVIPDELLFAAPGLPTGHYVMGYNEQGHCPMLQDDVCSIYAQRPQTCRAYDCRIFTAAGMPPGETDKALVSQRTQRWQFRFASASDKATHRRIQRAAQWLESQRDDPASRLPQDFVPSNSTQLAVLALSLQALFTDNLSPADLASEAFADKCTELAP